MTFDFFQLASGLPQIGFLGQLLWKRQAGDGDFKCGALLGGLPDGFEVGAALQPSVQPEGIPCLKLAALQSQAAPGDAGEIVGPAVTAVDRQEQVADIPTQGGCLLYTSDAADEL